MDMSMNKGFGDEEEDQEVSAFFLFVLSFLYNFFD